LIGKLTIYGKALEDIIVATAVCSPNTDLHMQGMKGLSTGPASVAWDMFQSATKYACLPQHSSKLQRYRLCLYVALTMNFCWYRAALQWTTVYGRSVTGSYVQGGSHRLAQGKYSTR